tara:strand:+ start:41 stop:202 length:162 start_codon:yes stop_codon:yes gene_type:complete
MRIPDHNKMRRILSDGVDNNDYTKLTDEEILYEFVKTYGNVVPTIKIRNENES